MSDEDILIEELMLVEEELRGIEHKTLICGITNDDLQVMRELENKITELNKRLGDFE